MFDLIKAALKEDIGSGDITTDLIVPKDAFVEAEIIAKENGIVCGLEVAKEAFLKLDKSIKFICIKKDGNNVKIGERVAVIRGNARKVLSAERTALNFLQHLSGIATETKKYTDLVKGTKTIILDTRKTTPLLRSLEKKAVKCGGGKNHRFGLFDAVLIKDNHLCIEKDISNAIRKAKRAGKVEIEVKNIEELKTAVKSGADIILLDNMSLKELKTAVKIVRKISKKKIYLEASGGITKENVKKVAKTGVDFISIGSLTHSVKSLDFSLEVVKCRLESE